MCIRDSFKKRSGFSNFHGSSQVYSKEDKTDEKTKAEFVCTSVGYNQDEKVSTNKSKEKTVEKNRRRSWIICHKKQLNEFIQ